MAEAAVRNFTINFGPQHPAAHGVLSLMSERARFMARQPGFISISLHRSLDGHRIVNYIQWRSRDLSQSAHNSPEFRKEWSHFGQVTDDIDPHLYEVAHVMDGNR